MNSSTHLLPLKDKARKRAYVIADIESKDGPTQKAGFTRPFMVGGFAGRNVWNSGKIDNTQYRSFRNDIAGHTFRGPIRWDKQHLIPGGCVDRFMRWVIEELPKEIEESNKYDQEEDEQAGFRGLIIYAHNGGSFDHLHFLPWLKLHREEYEFEIVPVQSSIQEMQVKRRGDSKALWFFRDSMKLLPMGLQKACESLGVPGKEQDHSLELPEDSPLWDSYLKQDCIALDGVMGRLHELVAKLGGTVGMTAPSTSMSLFRRKYLKRGIPRHVHFDECNADTITQEEIELHERETGSKYVSCEGCSQQFFRDAYYGGRTELFRMEGENLHYYDINSSYVAAMCEPMPVGERFVAEGQIDWRMMESGWVGFADVEVEIQQDCPVPPLPYKHPNGKLMFPVGRFKGKWDVAELLLLEHPRVRGRVVSVGRVVWVRAKPIFSQMMIDLYDYRDKSRLDFDEGLSLLAKLLGNGLYGKFGQKKERTQIVHQREPAAGECFLCGGSVLSPAILCLGCVGSKPAGSLDTGIWYRGKSVDAQYIMPQISAHVTALARIKLFNFNMVAMDLGGKIYMNDTDSIITDVEMPTSTELGALKDEYPGDLLRYIGVQPKVYILEKMSGAAFMGKKAGDGEHLPSCKDKKKCFGCAPWKVAMKGFPKNMRTKENVLELRESLEKQTGKVVTFSRLEKVRSMAAKGFNDSPKMVVVERSFKSPYDKREVLPDGDTRPVVVDE